METPKGTDVAVREDVLREDGNSLTEISIGNQMVMDSMDVMKQIGRIEALQFVATVSDRVVAETYVNIKESKSYKNLPYRNSAGKPATVATIEEFCQAFMPKSYRRCEELASNLHILGPELYERSEAIGFRQRDYNALKALPAEEQAIVKQAIEAGKFDNAIELMQEMAARHCKEREALQFELEDVKKSSQEAASIAERQRQAKDAKINELDAKLSRSMPTPEFLHEEALGLLSAQAIKCAASVQTSLRSELGRLFGVSGEAATSEQARQAAAAALGQVLAAVRDVAADYGVLADASAVIYGEAQENADIWKTVGAQYEQATGG